MPSLDLDDLVSITSENNVNDINAMDVETPAAASTTRTAGRAKNSKPSNTTSTSVVAAASPASAAGGGGHYMHLLNRPMAGQALGDHKVTSFDIVAGAVTAPSLRQQSSFDGAYLPTPSDDFSAFFTRNNTSNSMNRSNSNSKISSGFGSADGIATTATATTGVGIGAGAVGAGLITKPSAEASDATGVVNGSTGNNLAPPGRVFLSTGDNRSSIGGGSGHSGGGVDGVGIGSGRPPLGATATGTGTCVVYCRIWRRLHLVYSVQLYTCIFRCLIRCCCVCRRSRYQQHVSAASATARPATYF